MDSAKKTCVHCGDSCPDDSILSSELIFCCFGCKTVFELFNSSGLEKYYELESEPGTRMKTEGQNPSFAFLDLPEVQEKYLLFKNERISKVSLLLPQIHCSACIWLLENMNRLHPGVISSMVNFSKKNAAITYNSEDITLRELAELLSKIGYTPDFSSSKNKETSSDKSLIYKIGIAGFCFGNIMLLAFPEYLGIDKSFDKFSKFFGYLSLLLSAPVFFYAGWEYIQSAFKSIQQKYINIDVPIALGMLTLMLRSAYEIISGTGVGYFDSLAGLVFFLLLGKWFQKKSYDSLTFDRDYKSYFPIAVNKLDTASKLFSPVKIEELAIGDILEIRNGELIPADSTLVKGDALIDYSFVTGEADLAAVKNSDQIYAGGRQSGTSIQVKTKKTVNNSYLTELWNKEAFTKKEELLNLSSLSNKVSKYFTIIILLITAFTAIYWYFSDIDKLWNSVTAVLIVACPCALALSVPFTLGSSTRIFGRLGLYLKSSDAIEKMAKISSVVFDKTGTITHRNGFEVNTTCRLSDEHNSIVKALSGNSIHPLSNAINSSIKGGETEVISNFSEIAGQGISGVINGELYKLGSGSFTDSKTNDNAQNSTQVFFTENGKLLTTFYLEQTYRSGLESIITKLKTKYKLYLLSGDNDREKEKLEKWLKLNELHFDQSPADKLEFISKLQKKQEKVMMLGDGLNDAGALKQSDFGIAVSDSVHQFSPACDAILRADEFSNLDNYLLFSKKSIGIIKRSFMISFLYNIIGLSFAVTGNLSPIIAAILMPISSVTVVLFSTLATRSVAKHLFPKN